MLTTCTIQGTKFSTILNSYPDYLVGKNLGGGGIIVLARSPNGYFFLTWSSAEVELPPTNIHAEVARMAALFR